MIWDGIPQLVSIVSLTSNLRVFFCCHSRYLVAWYRVAILKFEQIVVLLHTSFRMFFFFLPICVRWTAPQPPARVRARVPRPPDPEVGHLCRCLERGLSEHQIECNAINRGNQSVNPAKQPKQPTTQPINSTNRSINSINQSINPSINAIHTYIYMPFISTTGIPHYARTVCISKYRDGRKCK